MNTKICCVGMRCVCMRARVCVCMGVRACMHARPGKTHKGSLFGNALLVHRKILLKSTKATVEVYFLFYYFCCRPLYSMFRSGFFFFLFLLQKEALSRLLSFIISSILRLFRYRSFCSRCCFYLFLTSV